MRPPIRIHPSIRLALALVAILGVVACAEQKSDPEAARPEIEAMLGKYLPLLGEAYSQNEPTKVEGIAAGREMAAIEKRLRDIRMEGRRLEPTFQSLTVEEIKVWGYANAYVTTQEIWDIRTYATGTDQLLTEQKAQRNRVKYQLKKIDGEWKVLFRTILD